VGGVFEEVAMTENRMIEWEERPQGGGSDYNTLQLNTVLIVQRYKGNRYAFHDSRDRLTAPESVVALHLLLLLRLH